jgi:hypothetical protein
MCQKTIDTKRAERLASVRTASLRHVVDVILVSTTGPELGTDLVLQLEDVLGSDQDIPKRPFRKRINERLFIGETFFLQHVLDHF